MPKPKQKDKVKVVKGWAVLSDGKFEWGYLEIRQTKKEALKQSQLYILHGSKVVPITISYIIPKAKSKKK